MYAARLMEESRRLVPEEATDAAAAAAEGDADEVAVVDEQDAMLRGGGCGGE
jgi:hypothetical protein